MLISGHKDVHDSHYIADINIGVIWWVGNDSTTTGTKKHTNGNAQHYKDVNLNITLL